MWWEAATKTNQTIFGVIFTLNWLSINYLYLDTVLSYSIGMILFILKRLFVLYFKDIHFCTTKASINLINRRFVKDSLRFLHNSFILTTDTTGI